MGDITEMMGEGLLCCVCGVYLGPEDFNKEWTPTGTFTECEDCKH